MLKVLVSFSTVLELHSSCPHLYTRTFLFFLEGLTVCFALLKEFLYFFVGLSQLCIFLLQQLFLYGESFLRDKETGGG